ncbi:MAG TPA: O-antigen ligase family protein, partial [Flavisolibacter sp.]|nr:O-antigen ligase family protein [Flavisolibacter sp.]
SFLAFTPGRILNAQIPVSTGVEILILLTFLGASWQKRQVKSRLWQTPISIAFFCYGIFFLVEFFNPNMESLAGYILYLRKFLMFVFIYILAYKLLDTKEKAKFFFQFWIIASFITAVYGCFQQWFGLLPFEMKTLMNDPHEYKLLFQGGILRKFSILSDPVQFGILSGSMSLFSLMLAIHEKSRDLKIIYFFITAVLILGMLYSGTRTTIIILPSGIALYTLMSLHNKRSLIVLFSFFIISVGILFAPIDSPALNRMRSSLNPKEASLDIRTVHRKYIQPYIYYHPLGGGMATSGVDGVRFNPNHVLSGFPPDSGFLKYAIETGWVGYAIVMAFFFIILIEAVNYYFLAVNEEIKLYMLALTVTLFAITISQYAQVALGQLPMVIFFYAGLSLLKRLLEFSNDEPISELTLNIKQ